MLARTSRIFKHYYKEGYAFTSNSKFEMNKLNYCRQTLKNRQFRSSDQFLLDEYEIITVGLNWKAH